MVRETRSYDDPPLHEINIADTVLYQRKKQSTVELQRIVCDTGLLLPLVEDCVRDVDLVQRRVVVAPGFAEHG